MTHIVLGYRNFDESLRLVEAMVEAGVDLMELQIPFSEPIADGPVILRANQEALNAGSTVDQCLELGEEVAAIDLGPEVSVVLGLIAAHDMTKGSGSVRLILGIA